MKRERNRLLCGCALAAPAVWFTLLCAAWRITPPAHEPDRLSLLLVLHALALVLACAPGAVVYRDLRWLRRAAPHQPAADRARRLAASALVLSATAVLLVLASAVALVLLAPEVAR